MPLKQCSDNGKNGWKYGDSGKCYTGPEGKKNAIKQGIKIDGPEKFSQKACDEGMNINEGEIHIISDMLYEEGYKLNQIVAITASLNSIIGYTEFINEDNFIVPAEDEYVDFGEETEYWDIAADRPGLWENIRKKKKREGDSYRPAKPGDPDRPDPDSYKKAQSKFEYEHPKTGEKFFYSRRGVYKKEGYILRYIGEAAAAERKVKLNKPFRTPNASKKKAVYVRNDKGNVVLVRFGDKDMKNRSNDPERKKSFRARHNCDNPGPKWKPRYWACKDW